MDLGDVSLLEVAVHGLFWNMNIKIEQIKLV
jgi:hypothetical protein